MMTRSSFSGWTTIASWTCPSPHIYPLSGPAGVTSVQTGSGILASSSVRYTLRTPPLYVGSLSPYLGRVIWTYARPGLLGAMAILMFPTTDEGQSIAASLVHVSP